VQITLPFLNSRSKHSVVCIKCQDKEKSVALVEMLVKLYVVFGGFDISSPGSLCPVCGPPVVNLVKKYTIFNV